VGEGHRLNTGVGRGRRRWQLVVVGGVLVAIVAVVAAVLAIVNHDPTPKTGLGASTPPVSAPPPGSGAPSGGPKPPAEGAYVGAYVQPDTDYTPQGRIDAVTAFEKSTGRQLDIVQTFHPWDDEFPDQTDKWAIDNNRMLLLSWAGTDTRVIQTGRYDDLIRQRAEAIRDLGKPIFLRFRWEMDRPNLQASIWTPQDYIAAWRHVRKIFTEAKATNVSWVWCPTAAGFVDGDRAAAYYPGDSDVDWLCADVYTGQKLDSFGAAAGPFLDWAKGHPDKPVMIGEWATSDQFPGGQTAWLQQAQQTAQDNPSIKALVYFDSNDKTKGPRAQLALKGEAVGRFGQLLAEPYFNPRKLPTGR
jgi:Glycosyl hydrolase family 26